MRPGKLLAALVVLGLLSFAGWSWLNNSSATNPHSVRFPEKVHAGSKLVGAITYKNTTDHVMYLMQINANVSRYAQVFGVRTIDYNQMVAIPSGQLFTAKIDIDISAQAEGDATVEVVGTFLDQSERRDATNTAPVTITQ